MAQLAIKGHATRGREVIELLEMLGGVNENKLMGCCEDKCYWFGTNERMIVAVYPLTDWTVFTLEEFLEKSPYKVGDKVIIKSNNQEAIVTEVTWEYNTIMYRLKQNDDLLCKYIAYELQPYKEEEAMENKEETMEVDNEKPVNHVYDVEIISFDIAQKDRYELDLHGKFDVKLREGKYYIERIKHQYPKTYEECCRIVNANPRIRLTYDLSDGQKYSYDADNLHVYESIRKLLICRDAYWKIAGEKMGLGKPWKPDWKSSVEKKWVISRYNGELEFGYNIKPFRKFAFPSKEMRDAFKENFIIDLETCKELL